MLLNNLFIDSPINFEKKCKTRITASCFLMALGVITIALSFLAGDQIPVLYMAADHYDFIPGFYMGTGFGLFFAAPATIIKNVRYLKKPEIRKEREIYETDERNRMLGLRSWAYAGYTMLLLLYIGILISGFISILILKTLLIILAVYVVVLFVFRMILQKTM
ncbi:MAG: hypothetical protein ACLTZG_17285 [Hungatella hathewayi]|uniref:hypothetical protein n=1 Tax=Hungatella hathewayi TaxID=154046 RepID=UPI0039964EBE